VRSDGRPLAHRRRLRPRRPAQDAPGERLVFLYRGRVNERAPIALASFRSIFDRLLASDRARAEDYYVGLIEPTDCPAPSQLPWARLAVYGAASASGEGPAKRP